MSQQQDDIDIDFELPPPDKLYAHHRRQLSAMLDGELSPDQARFMLRRLQHDGELAACWERWQVCGDILRGRGHALLPADFSRRVAAAIAAPAAAPAAAGGRGRGARRMLHWGGGALAASVALVALFMARQMPEAVAPGLAGASGAPVEAAAVERPAAPLVAATTAVDAAPAPQGPVDASGGGAAALLSAAAPAALAVAELPRRTAERGSTRSQAQRAAARRSQAAAPASRLVAASAPPAAGGGAVQLLPPPAGLQDFAVGASGGDALFGAPTAPPRPWPRAVLPALSGRQPFAAGYGLPQGEAFAPFQPRLARDPAAAPPAAGGDPDAGQAPADAGSGEPPIPDPAG